MPITTYTLMLVSIGVLYFIKDEDDKHSAFPRWLGYISIFQAIEIQLELGALIFKSGPFAYNGFFAFYLPFILFFIWAAGISYSLLGAIRHQEQTADVS